MKKAKKSIVKTRGAIWVSAWSSYIRRNTTEVIFEDYKNKIDQAYKGENFTKFRFRKLLRLFSATELLPEFFGLKANDDRMDFDKFCDTKSNEWLAFKKTVAGLTTWKKDKLRKNVEQGIEAIAAVVRLPQYEKYQDGKEKTLGEVIKTALNPNELKDKYIHQPCIVRGTSILIRKDLLLTAAHNLTDENGWIEDKELAYIFDFRYTQNGVRPAINPKNVYYGKKLDCGLQPFDDWILVHLNPSPRINKSRCVDDRTPLNISRDQRQPNFPRGFYSAGFSLGVPMKLTLVGHYVMKLTEKLFATNLDMFHGNSGSPIITLNSNELVGILLAGFPDFEEPENNTIQLRQYFYGDIRKGQGGERCRWTGLPFIDEMNAILKLNGFNEDELF